VLDSIDSKANKMAKLHSGMTLCHYPGYLIIMPGGLLVLLASNMLPLLTSIKMLPEVDQHMTWVLQKSLLMPTGLWTPSVPLLTGMSMCSLTLLPSDAEGGQLPT
jgi:hypothetical protein